MRGLLPKDQDVRRLRQQLADPAIVPAMSNDAAHALGAAAAGTALDASRHDHVHPKVTEAEITLADVTTLNASTSLHGLLLKATAPGAGLLNVVGIGNGETAYTNKALFNDAALPAALGTAAYGTQVVAARRDHVHANILSNENPHAFGTAAPGTATDASRHDHVHAKPVWG